MAKKKIDKSKKVEKKSEGKPKQLSLGLKSPFVNVFFNLKNRIVARLNLFEANKFINDPLVWAMVAIQIVGTFYQLLYLLNNIEKVPSVIPLFGYASISSETLIPKFYYLVLPLVSFIIVAYTFRLARSNYFKNTLLAHYTLFLGVMFIISLCLHIIKVISQYV